MSRAAAVQAPTDARRGVPPSLPPEAIRIRGARTHNLQNFDLEIPHDRLVVITGLSGSGKSSLAFDTLLAEGQRQYIESLSVYARQFFDQIERPDVDVIEGLQPTIAIDQHRAGSNPRSTVATVTEIYDFLRVLMARVGQASCPNCGTPIAQQTPAEIQQAIESLPEQTKVMILAPIVRGRQGKHADAFDRIRREGFIRVRIDGVAYEVEQVPELSARQPHDIEAVVDRVIVRPGLENRLAESVRLALKHGEGALRVSILTPEAKAKANGANAKESTPENGWQEQVFSTQYACPDCKSSLAEVEPRTFSFNSPYGACRSCDGLGAREGFDPELVLPDMGQSLADGAFVPWQGATAAARTKHRQLLKEFLAKAKVDWDRPLEKWPERARRQLLAGDGDKFPGLMVHLEMDHAKAKRTSVRERLEEFRSQVVCADCGGSRLQSEARACRLAGRAIHEITALPIEAAQEFFESLELDASQLPIAEPLVAEIVKRLSFLRRGRRGVSVARSLGRLVERRRDAARAAGHWYRLWLGGRALHPRRTVDRSASPRQRAADPVSQGASATGKHRAGGGARRSCNAGRRLDYRHGPRRGSPRRAHRLAGHV